MQFYLDTCFWGGGCGTSGKNCFDIEHITSNIRSKLMFLFKTHQFILLTSVRCNYAIYELILVCMLKENSDRKQIWILCCSLNI
jgi:hypothetical protein